jgi:hypothetical protein
MASVDLTFSIAITMKNTVKVIARATATGMTPKVFAIEVLPASADPEAPKYRFSHICSPSELVEFSDDLDAEQCWFRTDEITMVFDTPVNARLVIDNIKADVKKLVDEYNALQAAPVTEETVTFGE